MFNNQTACFGKNNVLNMKKYYGTSASNLAKVALSLSSYK